MFKRINYQVLTLKLSLKSLIKWLLSKSLISKALNGKLRKQFFETLLPMNIWGIQFYIPLKQKYKVILITNSAYNSITY